MEMFGSRGAPIRKLRSITPSPPGMDKMFGSKGEVKPGLGAAGLNKAEADVPNVFDRTKRKVEVRSRR